MAGSGPGFVTWPEKLITQAEAFVLAADWPTEVRVDLLCGRCKQSVGQLQRDGLPYNATLDEKLSAVLRHMVMAHDVQLSGLRTRESGGDSGS
jgi:hypothetical protein